MLCFRHYHSDFYPKVKIEFNILMKFHAFTSFILQKSVLECLRNVYENHRGIERKNITNIVVDLWHSLSEDLLIKYELLQSVLTSMIHVTGCIINSLNSTQICQVSLLIVFSL